MRSGNEWRESIAYNLPRHLDLFDSRYVSLRWVWIAGGCDDDGREEKGSVMFSQEQINWLYQSETNRGTRAEKRVDSVLMTLAKIDSEYDKDYDKWWIEKGRFGPAKYPDWDYRSPKSIRHHKMTIALAMPDTVKK